MCMRACMCASVHACVCVHECTRACMHACIHVNNKIKDRHKCHTTRVTCEDIQMNDAGPSHTKTMYKSLSHNSHEWRAQKPFVIH